MVNSFVPFTRLPSLHLLSQHLEMSETGMIELKCHTIWNGRLIHIQQLHGNPLHPSKIDLGIAVFGFSSFFYSEVLDNYSICDTQKKDKINI